MPPSTNPDEWLARLAEQSSGMRFMAAKKKKVAPKARNQGSSRPNKGERGQFDTSETGRGRKQAHRLRIFVQEYLVDLNGGRAARAAGYAPQSARITASELLARPDVQSMVEAGMEERIKRTGITADRALERLWAIATADPRELIELHRSCCRYCYGKNHRYQRTPREMENDRAVCNASSIAALAEGKPGLIFDEAGGLGWDPRKDPHPDCPECFGEGTERILPKDTRDLSPAARALYAGVKTTQHGLEIKLHDQTGMLVNVGRHLGLFRERVEVTGKDGKPIESVIVAELAGLVDAVAGAGMGVGKRAKVDDE